MEKSAITVTLNPSIDKTIILSSLEVGGLNRVKEIWFDSGGKGINAAKMLAVFNVNVTAAGLIAGAQGGQLVTQLEDKGINVDFMKLAGETRTNLKIFDEQLKQTTEINEQGFSVTEEDMKTFRQGLREAISQASILILAGSLPHGVPAAIYQEIIEMAHAHKIPTIFDADGEAFKQGVKAKPYAVKPNIFELEQWSGRTMDGEQDVIAAAKELIAEGIKLVLVSMGKLGALLVTEQEVYRVTTFAIQVGSTVGAGDSMVAALAYCLLNGKSLQETAKWTTVTGTLAASKKEAQVCTYEDIVAHLDQVQVMRIDDSTDTI